MKVTAIVGGGPEDFLPVLNDYIDEVSVWIGADRGALSLIQQGIVPDIAVGDFDSVTEEELQLIKNKSAIFCIYQQEKDETDLELAIMEAMKQDPDVVYLYGVTGGRLDHELANLQLLYLLKQKRIEGCIIDKHNEVKLVFPGTHCINKRDKYPYVSFIPFSAEVKGITLTDFYYPLQNASLQWGSTRCISNNIEGEQGVLTFTAGILFVINSKDSLEKKSK